MTVIAAFLERSGGRAAPLCHTMLEAQAPDGWSPRIAAAGEASLGSAFPAGAGDAAPVTGAGGALTLVADVRLDNREELARRLGLTPADAARHADPALMMLCFEQWSEGDAIAGFVGDFALILWDRRDRRLVLARDFAGQRPLHYHEGHRAVAAASRAAGLHALDFVPRGVDEQRMLEMLAGLPHEGPSSFFAGVSRVEPGEAIAFQRDRRSSRTFWTAPTDTIRFRRHEDYAEALAEQLDAAVEARLRGAGAVVATHLSAGLDSAAVTASAARLFSGRVAAYTAVPPARIPDLPAGRFGDEGALAAETAALYPNVDHRLIDMGERIPLDALEGQHRLFERPDLNLPNLTWSNRINDAARAEGAGVMLVGTMGNSTFSYGGLELLGELLRKGRILAFLSESVAHLRGGTSPRSVLGQTARQILPPGLLRKIGRARGREYHPASGLLNLGAPGIAQILARFDAYQAVAHGSEADIRVGSLRRVDPGSYNKGVLLGWNIDVRDPTADRRLVEYCLRVPLREYVRGGTTRSLARSALRGRVPENVRLARERGLQSPHWFAMLSAAGGEATRLLDEISGCAAAGRLVDLPKARRLIESWPQEEEGEGPLLYRFGLLRGLSAGAFIRLNSARDPPLG
jgi:asparagine synthase (glutamine-hydrolysing)